MSENQNPKNKEPLSNVEEVVNRCITICEDKKAADIVLFDVHENSILADYYLICCGNSLPHIRALAENLRRTLVEEGYRQRGQEGSPSSQWIILDYGTILIHIMTPEMRRFYCLEDLWDKRLVIYEGGEELPELRTDTTPALNEEDDTFEESDFEEDELEEDDFEDDDEFEDDEDDEFDDEDDEEDDEDEEDEEDEEDDDDEDDEEDDDEFEDEFDDEEYVDEEIIDVDDSDDKKKDEAQPVDKGYTFDELFAKKSPKKK